MKLEFQISPGKLTFDFFLKNLKFIKIFKIKVKILTMALIRPIWPPCYENKELPFKVAIFNSNFD
jgi:hypothetical protein